MFVLVAAADVWFGAGEYTRFGVVTIDAVDEDGNGDAVDVATDTDDAVAIAGDGHERCGTIDSIDDTAAAIDTNENIDPLAGWAAS